MWVLIPCDENWIAHGAKEYDVLVTFRLALWVTVHYTAEAWGLAFSFSLWGTRRSKVLGTDGVVAQEEVLGARVETLLVALRRRQKRSRQRAPTTRRGVQRHRRRCHGREARKGGTRVGTRRNIFCSSSSTSSYGARSIKHRHWAHARSPAKEGVYLSIPPARGRRGVMARGASRRR